jgi:hypothetical protein
MSLTKLFLNGNSSEIWEYQESSSPDPGILLLFSRIWRGRFQKSSKLQKNSRSGRVWSVTSRITGKGRGFFIILYKHFLQCIVVTVEAILGTSAVLEAKILANPVPASLAWSATYPGSFRTFFGCHFVLFLNCFQHCFICCPTVRHRRMLGLNPGLLPLFGIGCQAL